MPAPTLFTIGHSNREIGEFLGLLREHEIELIVDVRRLPGSSRYPQFNMVELAATLRANGVGYERLNGLTGRRSKSKTVPFEMNAWWEHRSFHNYADHAQSLEFRDALRTLESWGSKRRVAVMCSEAVWWRCHRRIIADFLLADGIPVHHILGHGQAKPAELTAGAVIGAGGQVTYPVSGG